MAAEPLHIFDTRHTIQRQGFSGRTVTTMLHDAAATSFRGRDTDSNEDPGGGPCRLCRFRQGSLERIINTSRLFLRVFG